MNTIERLKKQILAKLPAYLRNDNQTRDDEQQVAAATTSHG